jgi:hypothetical protein
VPGLGFPIPRQQRSSNVHDFLLAACVAARAWRVSTAHRLARDERGEGVISAAIAVLIMAFLGALMWVAFKSIWANAEHNTRTQVNSIGG